MDGGGTVFKMVEGSYEGRLVYYFIDTTEEWEHVWWENEIEYREILPIQGTYALTAIHYSDSNTGNPYFDRPDFYVDPNPYEEGNTYQMWEPIPYDYRIDNILKAQANPQRGMDATFLVPAYSFGNGDEHYKWITTYDAGGYGTGTKKNDYFTCVSGIGQWAEWRGGMWRVGMNPHIESTYYAGAFLGIGAYSSPECYNNFTVETKIENLPKGYYKLYMQTIATGMDVVETITPTPTALNGNDYSNTIYNNIPEGLEMEIGADNVPAVGEFFQKSEANGKRELDIYVGDDGIITLKYNVDDNTNKYAFYIDNIQLTYFGENKDESVYEKTIKLDFSNEWNTVILPFDAQLPEGLGAYSVEGINKHSEYDAHYLSLPLESTSSLKANTPYVVENPNAPKLYTVDESSAAPRRRAESVDEDTDDDAYSFVAEFKGVPTNMKNAYADENNILVGVMEQTVVDTEHYQLDATEVEHVFNNATDKSEVAANRAYINKNNDALSYSLIYFSDERVTTGVEAVAAEATDDAPVEYFNLQGIRVMNPTKGIFIRRRGTTTEKIIL